MQSLTISNTLLPDLSCFASLDTVGTLNMYNNTLLVSRSRRLTSLRFTPVSSLLPLQTSIASLQTLHYASIIKFDRHPKLKTLSPLSNVHFNASTTLFVWNNNALLDVDRASGAHTPAPTSLGTFYVSVCANSRLLACDALCAAELSVTAQREPICISQDGVRDSAQYSESDKCQLVRRAEIDDRPPGLRVSAYLSLNATCSCIAAILHAIFH